MEAFSCISQTLTDLGPYMDSPKIWNRGLHLEYSANQMGQKTNHQVSPEHSFQILEEAMISLGGRSTQRSSEALTTPTSNLSAMPKW